MFALIINKSNFLSLTQNHNVINRLQPYSLSLSFISRLVIAFLCKDYHTTMKTYNISSEIVME